MVGFHSPSQNKDANDYRDEKRVEGNGLVGGLKLSDQRVLLSQRPDLVLLVAEIFLLLVATVLELGSVNSSDS